MTSRTSSAVALGHHGHGLADRRGRGRAGPPGAAAGELLHVDARTGIEHRAALGQRDHRQRVRHPLGGQPSSPRADRRRCRPAAPSRRRPARRCRASAPRPSRPRRSRRRRPSGPCRSTARIASTAAWSAASLSPSPTSCAAASAAGLGHAHQLEREVAIRTGALVRRDMTPGGLRTRSVSPALIAPRRTAGSAPTGAPQSAEVEALALPGSPTGRSEPAVGDEAERARAAAPRSSRARPRQLVRRTRSRSGSAAPPPRPAAASASGRAPPSR